MITHERGRHRRSSLVVAAVAVAMALQTPVAVASGAGKVSLVRTHDPATHRPGILVTYSWDKEFGRNYGARVRLFQGQRLVGQIKFMRGWASAPAFFRTTASTAQHSFRAVGVLLRRNGAVVAGSTERSAAVWWRVSVQPGQVVP